MEIGLYLRHELTYENMAKKAKKADELGYFGGFLNDHVIGFGDDRMEPYLEAWTAMTGIGMETDNLRVGQIVLFNSLRNPAFLAKSIATLDNMTNGRYELLIGAGWNEREYTGYDLMGDGNGIPSAGERVSRFEETLKILNLMLNQKVTSFNGQFWQLEQAINVPQPVQKEMRVSVGCKGPRMMRITAENATGINISGGYIPTLSDLIDQFEKTVDQYTDKKLGDYYISGFTGIEVTEDQKRIDELVQQRVKRMNQEVTESDFLFGSAEDIASKLRRLQDKGMEMMVSSITVDNKLSSDPLAYFKDNVMTSI